MRLDLRFTKRPIEDLWCQAIVALVFQDEDMLSATLSSLNIKMAGALSNLVQKMILTGARGEKTLLATELMIKADKLLLYGLGNRKDYNKESLEECVDSLACSLDRIGINDFGIFLPVEEGSESRYPYQLEIVTTGLVSFFQETHRSESGFLLKIVFSIEDRMMDILSQVELRLRKCFTPALDFSIIIDRKTVIS